MRDLIGLTLLDAEKVRVRRVGNGVDFVVTTRRGALTLRLFARRGRSIQIDGLKAGRQDRRGSEVVHQGEASGSQPPELAALA